MELNENQVEQIYNGILRKIVEPMVGRDATYGSDLDKAGRQLLGTSFKGVYSADRIPALNGLKKYAIVNLDKLGQPGSHWIAVARDGRNTHVYDSFGRKSTKIIPDLFNSIGSGKVIDNDYDPEQKKSEENCGARSLAYLLLFDRWGADNAAKL